MCEFGLIAKSHDEDNDGKPVKTPSGFVTSWTYIAEELDKERGEITCTDNA